MNALPLSLCLGGRAKNLRRGYLEDPQRPDKLKPFVAYPGAVGPPTGTDRFIRSYSTTAGSPCSPAVMQVCPPTGAFRMVKSSVVSFLKLYLGQLLYYCPVNLLEM